MIQRAGLRVAGLFAGVGGLELGLHRAGHETELFCEIDPMARKVLSTGFNFPLPQIEEDIRDLQDIPADVQVITAGFPCQDLSSTGEKGGIEGEKSSLVGEVFRLLRKRPTEWLILENVPFMLQLRRGRAIRIITDELASLGYRWAYRVVDTRAFGLPHRRRRVFLIASRSSDPRDVLLSDDAGSSETAGDLENWMLDVPIGFYWTEGAHSTGLAYDSIPPLKPGSTIGIPSPPGILLPGGLVVKPHLRDGERLQGFPAGWTEPGEELGRRSFRWRLIGNAVTVDVAEWIGVRLTNPKPYDSVGDRRLKSNEKWPAAAWSMGNGTFVATGVTDHPRAVEGSGLSALMQDQPTPLSAKATRGFLKRAEAGGLRFPTGFLTSLEAHVERMDQS